MLFSPEIFSTYYACLSVLNLSKQEGCSWGCDFLLKKHQNHCILQLTACVFRHFLLAHR